MKAEVREIIRNSIYLYLIQGLNYLLPLLTLPFLIVTLSTESFGKYSFAFAFSQFVILFVDFGFNLTTTKKIAENSDDAIAIKETFWNILLIKSVFFIIAAIVTLVLTLNVDKLIPYKDGIWISLITVFGTVIFPVWWFQGMNRMKLLSVINAVSKLLTYPLIFVLVHAKGDANMAIFLQSSSMMLAGLFSFAYFYRSHRHYFIGRLFSRNKIDYLKEIKSSWPIFLSSSSVSLYTNSLTILLGFFGTPYNVGFFGSMERLVRVVCFGVLGPINQACFPLLARLKQTDLSKAKKIFKLVLLLVAILMSLAFAVFYLFKGYLQQILFKDYVGADYHLLSLFMLMIFPIALGGVLGQLGLMALGNELHKKTFAKVYIFVGLLSIPVSVISIFLFKIQGAVYSMIGVETSIFLVLLFMVRKYKFI